MKWLLNTVLEEEIAWWSGSSVVLSLSFVDFVIVELMGAVAVAPASGREGDHSTT